MNTFTNDLQVLWWIGLQDLIDRYVCVAFVEFGLISDALNESCFNALKMYVRRLREDARCISVSFTIHKSLLP